jgi:hypothetical protein
MAKNYPDFPQEFPDSWFNEEWAWKIHGQTLQHLNQRGGLGPEEMIMNIERLSLKECRQLTLDDAVKKLLKMLSQD